MDYKKHFEDMFSYMDEDVSEVVLSRTHLVDKIEDEEIKALLNYFYNSPNTLKNRIGSLLNSILYHRRYVFLFAKSNMSSVISSDKNIQLGAMNGKAYKHFIAKALEWKLLERLEEPTKSGKAGVYKVIDKNIVNILNRLIGEDMQDAQLESVLKIYKDVDNTRKEIPDFKEIERMGNKKRQERLNDKEKR